MRPLLRQVPDGFRRITLSPRLRRPAEPPPSLLWPSPLPPLPESAYGPDSVPLDMSGVPEWYRLKYGRETGSDCPDYPADSQLPPNASEHPRT